MHLNISIMKKSKSTFTLLSILIAVFILFVAQYANSQSIAITDDNGYSADASAMLDVKSITKGMLVPRLTTTQRNDVSSPATGCQIPQTATVTLPKRRRSRRPSPQVLPDFRAVF